MLGGQPLTLTLGFLFQRHDATRLFGRSPAFFLTSTFIPHLQADFDMTSTFPPLAQAVAGALGTSAANIGAYPLDLATTRLQTARGMKRKRVSG
jgi:hypothetical protein